MFSKKYLRWDLRFFNDKLEKDYALSNEKYQHIFLNITILFTFFVGIVTWIFNPNRRPDHFEGKDLILRVFYILADLIIFILGFKKPKWRKNMIILLIVGLFFTLMEMSQFNRQFWSRTMYFLAGLHMQFATFPIALGKISWKVSVLITSIMNLMNSFRYIGFEINQEMNFYPLFTFTQNSFLISLSAYFIEKIDRENFYRIKNYDLSLSRFEDLVSNIIPNAIVILKKNKVAFYNQESLTLLESNEEKELLVNLENIKIEKLEDIYQRSPLRNLKFLAKKKYDSMENLIINANSEKDTVSNSLYGTLKINDRIKNIEIKTTHIIWDNDRAFMIILSESKAVETMKIISEESDYKDKLLATVSHDLRSPLNGITGMIRVTMDMIQDKLALK